MAIETVATILYSKPIAFERIFDAFFDDAITRKRLGSVQNYKFPYDSSKDKGVILTTQNEEVHIANLSIQMMREHAHQILNQDQPFYLEVIVGLPRHIYSVRVVQCVEIELLNIRSVRGLSEAS